MVLSKADKRGVALYSKKCLVGGKKCEYPKVELWSSDDGSARRPNFVGQQAWSAVWQLPKDPRSADPFDSLPTGMPLKSRQLFQYCECLSTGPASRLTIPKEK